MKYKWIPIVLICCVSCMTTRYNFNNLKNFKQNPSQEIQMFIGSLEQNMNISSDEVTNYKVNNLQITGLPIDKSGIAVHLRGERIHSKSSELLNYLAYFTLCLLPCDYSTVYVMDIDYMNYTTKTEIIPFSFDSRTRINPGKIFLSEKLNYSVHQRGFFTDGFDETDRKGILELLIHSKRYKSGKIDFLNDLNPLLIHLENNYTFVVEKVNKELKEIHEKEKVDFASIDKNDCKALYEFSISESNAELQTTLAKAVAGCIDSKVIKILSKKYPFAKQHLTKKVFLMQTDLAISFYDLWNTVILGKNSKTGFKISQEDFHLTQQGKDKLRLKIKTLEGSTIAFIFQPNDKNIIITNIETKEQVGNWEETLEPVLKKFAEWPAPENWDWEYLNLK